MSSVVAMLVLVDERKVVVRDLGKTKKESSGAGR
jgi:hypothetical protein